MVHANRRPGDGKSTLTRSNLTLESASSVPPKVPCRFLYTLKGPGGSSTVKSCDLPQGNGASPLKYFGLSCTFRRVFPKDRRGNRFGANGCSPSGLSSKIGVEVHHSSLPRTQVPKIGGVVRTRTMQTHKTWPTWLPTFGAFALPPPKAARFGFVPLVSVHSIPLPGTVLLPEFSGHRAAAPGLVGFASAFRVTVRLRLRVRVRVRLGVPRHG